MLKKRTSVTYFDEDVVMDEYITPDNYDLNQVWMIWDKYKGRKKISVF